MEFKGDLEALVIRDLVTVLWTQDDFPDWQVSGKHLVEVATLTMSLSAWVDSWEET